MRPALYPRCVPPLALIFALLGCSSAPPPQSAQPAATDEKEPFTRISAQDLEARMARKGSLVIYDANMKDRFEQGHVPGARWIDVSTFGKADLPADTNATLVFYCFNKTCGASHLAATRAAKLGYPNVLLMVDGITGWEKAGKPTEKSPG